MKEFRWREKLPRGPEPQSQQKQSHPCNCPVLGERIRIKIRTTKKGCLGN